MRAVLTLIPSGLLLIVGGVLWGWRADHPTEQPGELPHRFPRSLHPSGTILRTQRDLPTQKPSLSEGHTSRIENNTNVSVSFVRTSRSGHRTRPTRTPTNSALEQGIFWSQALERALPRGFPEEDAVQWQDYARSVNIVSLVRGCGRSTNRLATLSDGSQMCVRYGVNPEQIQGEVLSYYLSRVLGIGGVPPCVLSKVGSDQWGPVQAELAGTGWMQGALVTLTPWVYNLSSVLPPVALRGAGGQLRPLREELRTGNTSMEELAQWADLIVFDYLTANFDRLVSNLFSLQWDPHVMLRGTNNLHRAPDGTLVLLDNEAGLAHGFRLQDTWDKYNEQLLGTVCLFRRGVANKLWELHTAQTAAQKMHSLYIHSDPLAAELGTLSEAQAQILQNRVGMVYRHILSCQDRYS
ncbi:four-jointed box protein 1 [Rhinophrynus dorsalis]